MKLIARAATRTPCGGPALLGAPIPGQGLPIRFPCPVRRPGPIAATWGIVKSDLLFQLYRYNTEAIAGTDIWRRSWGGREVTIERRASTEVSGRAEAGKRTDRQGRGHKAAGGARTRGQAGRCQWDTRTNDGHGANGWIARWAWNLGRIAGACGRSPWAGQEAGVDPRMDRPRWGGWTVAGSRTNGCVGRRG